MAYAALTTVANIQPYFNDETFDTTSIPTKAQIEAWITEGTAIIYSALSSLYVVPITDGDDLLVLRHLCNSFVIDEVNFAKSRGTYSAARKNARLPKQKRHDAFYEFLKGGLLSGEIDLPNSTGATDKAGLYSYTQANSIEAVGQKEETQW